MAVVSVSSFFDIFSGVKAIFDEPVEPLAVLDSDTDHDGLPDSEESYWDTDFENPDTDGDGFLDGEEVASRHDPTIPGPNDSLVDANLTEKVANLALGGLLEGSLKLDNASFETSVESLTLSVMDDGLVSFIPEIDLSQIKTNAFTKENQDIYYKQASAILEKFIKALYQEAGEIDSKLGLMDKGGMANPKFIEYFLSQRKIFDSIAKEGMQITVPSDWSSRHVSFIDYVLQFSEVNESLAQGKDDPIRAAIGFNLFISLIEDFPTVIGTFAEN